MDILIFVFIFGILPQIIKGVAKKQYNKAFKSSDIEDVPETQKTNTVQVLNNQAIEKPSSCAYESKLGIDEKYNLSVEKNKSKVNFKGKEDLKRAVIMSEILGKPRALKDNYR